MQSTNELADLFHGFAMNFDAPESIAYAKSDFAIVVAGRKKHSSEVFDGAAFNRRSQ